MKKIAALSALALVATAGSAMAQNASLQTRFLVQSVTGTGATYKVTNIAAPASLNVGDKIRVTLQYRLDGDIEDGFESAQGLAAAVFQINNTGSAAGTFERSILVGRNTPNPSRGEVSTLNSVHGVFDYAAANVVGEAVNVNTSNVLTFTQHGLHGPYRAGIDRDGANDQLSANGAITASSLTIAPVNLFSAGAYQSDGTARWYGLYSFDFTATSSGTVNLLTSVLPADGTTTFKYWNINSTQPINGNLVGPQASLSFGVTGGNTAPTIAEVSPINGAPNFTPVPDINNVLIATVTDAEGILAGQVMAMLNTGTPDNLGSLVFSTNQVDANTVQVFMSYEIVNSDLAGGPKSFTVKINANDGDLAAAQKVVTVNLVPAPGAAALLGLGGLIAARRRRA